MSLSKYHTATILFLLYLATVMYLVFFAWWRMHPAAAPFTRINAIPLLRYIHFYASAGHSSKAIIEFYTDLIGNLLLLAPLPWFLRSLFAIHRTHLLLLVLFFSSLFIETGQFIFNIGTADVDDVIMNTLGGLLVIIMLQRGEKQELKKHSQLPVNNELCEDCIPSDRQG